MTERWSGYGSCELIVRLLDILRDTVFDGFWAGGAVFAFEGVAEDGTDVFGEGCFDGFGEAVDAGFADGLIV